MLSFFIFSDFIICSGFSFHRVFEKSQTRFYIFYQFLYWKIEINYFLYKFLLRVAIVNPGVILDFFFIPPTPPPLQAMLLSDSIIPYDLKFPTFFFNKRKPNTK